MRCFVCGVVTTFDRCRRCERPVCMEHALLAGMRCYDCEYEFSNRRENTGRWGWLGVAAVVAVVVALWPYIPEGRHGGYRAITTGFPKLDVLIIAGFAAYFFARGAISLRVSYLRRRFLDERAPRVNRPATNRRS